MVDDAELNESRCQHSDDFSVWQQLRNSPIQIVRGYVVMCFIIRSNALRCDHDFIVALVGVYDGGAYARMGIGPSNDQQIRAEVLEVDSDGSKECAIAS